MQRLLLPVVMACFLQCKTIAADNVVRSTYLQEDSTRLQECTENDALLSVLVHISDRENHGFSSQNFYKKVSYTVTTFTDGSWSMTGLGSGGIVKGDGPGGWSRHMMSPTLQNGKLMLHIEASWGLYGKKAPSATFEQTAELPLHDSMIKGQQDNFVYSIDSKWR